MKYYLGLAMVCIAVAVPAYLSVKFINPVIATPLWLCIGWLAGRAYAKWLNK